MIYALGLAILLPAEPAAARCRAHHCTWHGMRHAGWHLRTPLRRMGYRWHRYRYHQVARAPRRERRQWYAVVSVPAPFRDVTPRTDPAPAPASADWKPDPTGWPDGWLERGSSPARWRAEVGNGN